MDRLTIGIRREDKNIWEKRVPLVPSDVGELIQRHGFRVLIEPSRDHRAFPDSDYLKVGAEIAEELSEADIIVGVKEIPISKFMPGKVYLFFSHVIKGQVYNMPMLKTIMEKNCTLVDYEKIESQDGKRLIFFGRYAGLAGMVESLSTYGKRLEKEGISNPFSRIEQPYRYRSLEDCLDVIREVSAEISRNRLPIQIVPFVCGVTGYGNVSKGVQEVLDLLPVVTIKADQLKKGLDSLPGSSSGMYKVVFEEKDMFKPRDSNKLFELQDYYKNPQNYVSTFMEAAPMLSLMVNCIYWTDSCPRLLTRQDVRSIYRSVNPKLKVIGDISCDIEGSVEVTVKATEVDKPCYVFDVDRDEIVPGVSGNGPTIMAIENLPCEIPLESSSGFSSALAKLLPEMREGDFSKELDKVGIPDEIRGAVIVLNGELTEKYRYLEGNLAKLS